MKVSVITLQNVNNYGSVLQALATQDLFQKNGCDVEIVNYIRKDITEKGLYKHWAGNNILKKLVIMPTIQKWKKVFGKFNCNNLNLTKEVYTTYNDFVLHPIEADIYCTGSDQVWNSKWNKGILPEFYLAYAYRDKYKIAFCASFGKNKISEEEVSKTKDYISQYQSITVREDSAVDIIKNTYGYKNVTRLLDPTLALCRNEWRKISKSNRKIKSDYILIYNLNRSKEFDQYAKTLSDKTGLKLVRLCTRFDQCYRVGKPVLIPEVVDFINLIDYASFVLTDSFHATAFSLNMNTQPISVLPKEFENRLVDFLKTVKCSQCIVKDYTDFDVVNRKVDFDMVNELLDEERRKVDNYIKNVISDYKGESKK